MTGAETRQAGGPCRDTTNCIVTGGSLVWECVTIQPVCRDRRRLERLGGVCRDTPCCIVTEKKAWPQESVSLYRFCIVTGEGLATGGIVSQYN